MVKNYPLQSEIWELDQLDAEANYYYERAEIWRNRGNIDDELYHYLKALELNPNHFNALFRLAEAYRKNQKFQEAVELYDRAYKINSQRAKEGYIESLLGYGDSFFQNSRLLERNLSLVKRLYERVLEIESKNTIALEKIERLITKEKYISIPVSHSEKLEKIPIRLVIFTAVLAVPLLIGIGVFLGLIIKPVPDFQPEQTLSYEYKKQRFSIGENTVFSKTNNENYSRFILICNQEFKEKNYDEAANCFERLAKAYRSEPEPLIYYNNSLAREDSRNPLIIAVVVPVDKNRKTAQEILRGVAQAQNEYNKTELKRNSRSPNTNIRLLEIVIANDSNNNKISPKIAQEIVERRDILGVIGHNDSSASKAALKVYEAKGLAMVASTSTSTELKGEVFFRTTINNSVLSKKLADYLQDLAIEKAMIFYNEQNSFSRSIKEFFDYEFSSLNSSKQVEVEDSSERFFNTQKAVQKAVDNQFEAAMLFADLGTIDLAIDVAKANYQLPKEQKLRLFGANTLYNCDALNKGQQAIIGLTLAVPWFKELPEAKSFVDRAIARWGGEVGWRTATSYDAAKAFIYALYNSGNNPTRYTVLEKLKEVNLPPEETSGRNLRFDPEGEITGQAILVEVVESLNPFCSNLDFRLLEE
ncbi:MAG: ABC transporter substrate-binding protein [Okeania sp. SIO3B3]|nr:ABC transporter substrate-binding protein [Okeania sp. SIO3B3]